MVCSGNNPKGKSLCHQLLQQDEGPRNEMTAAGRPLDNEELIEYIITSLDEEYTPLVSALCARAEPISLSEFYLQLLSFETHVGLLQDGHNRYVNASTQGGGFRGRGGMRGRSTGGRGPFIG
jgi:hypothetical protein